jgi:hypothetical protein
MIKKSILIITILLICSLLAYNNIGNKANKEYETLATKNVKERTETIMHISIVEMVTQTNAIDTWERDLSVDTVGFRPILTIELERLWLTNRPILFVGTIKDIATIDQDTYEITLNRALFGSSEYTIIVAELQLALQCQKRIINSFLNEHPDLIQNWGIKNKGIAVIADIDELETKTLCGSEDGMKEIKIGKGRCIDILYVGDVQ